MAAIENTIEISGWGEKLRWSQKFVVNGAYSNHWMSGGVHCELLVKPDNSGKYNQLDLQYIVNYDNRVNASVRSKTLTAEDMLEEITSGEANAFQHFLKDMKIPIWALENPTETMENGMQCRLWGPRIPYSEKKVIKAWERTWFNGHKLKHLKFKLLRDDEYTTHIMLIFHTGTAYKKKRWGDERKSPKKQFSYLSIKSSEDLETTLQTFHVGEHNHILSSMGIPAYAISGPPALEIRVSGGKRRRRV